MANEDRLDRVERILGEIAESNKSVVEYNRTTARILQEMAARQQYHDEAHERHDAAIKQLNQQIAVTASAIHDLLEIAELHQRRLDDLDNGQTA